MSRRDLILSRYSAVFQWQSRAVLGRHLSVYLRNWHTAALPPLLEPIILLLAFGFGLGAFIPNFAWRGQSSRHPEYYSLHGRLPSATNWLTLLPELGLSVDTTTDAASGAYVKRIWWNNREQEIRIRYGFDPVDDKVLCVRADFSPSGQAIWTCSAPRTDGVPVRYLPSTCRG